MKSRPKFRFVKNPTASFLKKKVRFRGRSLLVFADPGKFLASGSIKKGEYRLVVQIVPRLFTLRYRKEITLALSLWIDENESCAPSRE